jgi:hypothetical protein
MSDAESNLLKECELAVDDDLVFWYVTDLVAEEPEASEDDLLDHVERELWPHAASDAELAIWLAIASYVHEESRSVVQRGRRATPDARWSNTTHPAPRSASAGV